MSKLFPQFIRGYHLAEPEVGSGPVGKVYRAYSLLSRKVRAIKVLDEHWSSNYASADRFRRHFYNYLREASYTRHQHILHIEDAAADMARYYIIAEYCPDRSLRALLRRHAHSKLAWPLSQAVDLLRQTASGLAHAHMSNITHGNIKPSNLLLQRVEGNLAGYCVKLADFGGNPLDIPNIGQSDILLPADSWTYAMAPERFRLVDAEQNGHIVLVEPTTASDIYSLGVILYRALVGRLPFASLPIDLTQAYECHCVASWPTPNEVRPDLPFRLNQLILACMARDPAARPSASKLMAELEAALDDLQTGGVRTLGRVSPTMAPMAFPILEAPPSQPIADLYLPRLQVVDFASRVVAFGAPDRPWPDMNADSVAFPLQSITGDGLSIGRAPQAADAELGVTLNDDQLADTQMLVDWDGFRVVVTNLEDNGVVSLSGVPLPKGEARLWDWDAAIQAGSYYLQLLRPLRLLDTLSLASQPGAAIEHRQRATPEAKTDSHIILTPIPGPKLVIAPGQPASFSVHLRYNVRANDAPLVEQLDLRIEGGLARWIAEPARSVPINPDEEHVEVFEINVPRTSECRSGEYAMTIRAQSKIRDTSSKRLIPTRQVTWTVLPFADSKLDIQPKRQSAQRDAQYSVLVRNTGNQPLSFALSSEDDEQALEIVFSEPIVNVLPGQRRSVALSVHRPRHWFGRPQSRSFSITSAPELAGEQKSVAATFEQQPFFPTWVVASLALLFVLLCCISYLWRLWPASAFERAVANRAFYGVMRPTMTPQPTPTPPTFQLSNWPLLPSPTMTPTPTPTPDKSPTATLTPTDTPTPTSTSTSIPWTATPGPTQTPIPTPDPYPACPPRFVASIIEGRGGNPGEVFVVYFDNRPVGGGSPQTDVIGPDRRYRALVSIGDEHDGFHKISIRHADSVIAEFRCWIGPRPTVPPNVVITIPPGP